MSTMFMYRCRACGQTFQRPTSNEFGYTLRRQATTSALFAVHFCGPGQNGLADLIGERQVSG